MSMIAAFSALNYLSQIANRLFESQMERAAIKIRVRGERCPH
jgi:hypothetical protein